MAYARIRERNGNWLGELRYCSRVCRMKGTRDVPRANVGSYLELQRANAQRQGYAADEEARIAAEREQEYQAAQDAAADEECAA